MDIQTHRKLRLRELIDHSCGGYISVMAAKIERADTYIARMLYPVDKKGAKPVGDKMMLDIEAAFGLERAWFDKPMGHALPGTPATAAELHVAGGSRHVPDISDAGAQGKAAQTNIDWPFKIVSYRRLQTLQRALGHKRGHEAMRDIDKHLEIVTLKWEREVELAEKSQAV